MLSGQVIVTIESPLQHTYVFLVLILFPGAKKKQRAVAQSSTEAEYRALASAASQTL